jgi:hypothetical protein
MVLVEVGPADDGASHPVLRVPRWELRALIPRGALRLGIQPHVPVLHPVS